LAIEILKAVRDYIEEVTREKNLTSIWELLDLMNRDIEEKIRVTEFIRGSGK